jgi:hypothetical protein
VTLVLVLAALAVVLAAVAAALPVAAAAPATAALHELLHLLALLLGEHRPRVTSRGLRVLLDLLAERLALLAEAGERLALLLGELRALAALALAAAARGLPALTLLGAAHLGKASLLALGPQALHQGAVLALQALLDGRQALHLRVGQVQLLAAVDQRP